MLEEKDRIRSKTDLRNWLTYEKEKYGCGGKLRMLFPITEADVLYEHQRILRKTEYYVNTGSSLLSKIYLVRLQRIQNKYSLHISLNTCGRGLKIMHVGPILMNSRVRVGSDCSFHINTALVAGGTTDGVPTLEDGVVVGIGAVILGEVHIAKNVAIGANSVVTKSVEEENIAVAGVPARKVSENGRLCWNKSAQTKEYRL